MKKIIVTSAIFLEIVLLAGCNNQDAATQNPLPIETQENTQTLSQIQTPSFTKIIHVTEQAQSPQQENMLSVSFSLGDSAFQLPTGWTFKKISNSKGVNHYSFFDQNTKEVGGVNYYSTTLDKSIETSFDNCWRAWDIGMSALTDKNNKDASHQLAGKYGIDHFTYVAADGRTSVAAETCGKMSFIYWVPGSLITKSEDLSQYYNKKPVRVMTIHDVDTDESGFIQLIHNIAESVTINR